MKEYLNRPRNHLVLITGEKKKIKRKTEEGRRGGRKACAERQRGEEEYEGSSPCMAASSTDRLPPAGYTIAIVSTFFAPPLAYLSTPRILHLQGGVTLKTLPVLNYPVPLSPSFSLSLTHFFHPAPRYILPTLLQFLSALSTGLLSSLKSAQFLKFVQRNKSNNPFEKSLSSSSGRIFSRNVKKNLNF